MKKRILFLCLPAFLIPFSIAFSACGIRPVTVEAAPEQTPVYCDSISPSPLPYYHVSFYADGELFRDDVFLAGAVPYAPAENPVGKQIILWRNEAGETVDPSQETVTGDMSFYAETRPVLSANSKIFYGDENGFLLPDEQFTCADLKNASIALLGINTYADYLPDLSAFNDKDYCPASVFLAFIQSVFPPDDTAAIDLLDEYISRQSAAGILFNLIQPQTEEYPYYPDACPENERMTYILAFAEENSITSDEFLSATQNGYLWINGYLYRCNESGYLFKDVEEDGLYYDLSGRYTSGNPELDDFVAQTIVQYTDSSLSRLDNLKKLYYHIKNDFSYLVRNYYASGAVGWDTEEALTFFRTGKGNCYCYAGAFCSLAKGMGYNARTYSGSMGIENQPHAWTELTVDDVIYICDPEIEMNYWYLQMYVDTFMMRRDQSAGWNYQAVGR